MDPDPASAGPTLVADRIGPRSGSDPRAARAAERPLVLDGQRSVTGPRKRCPNAARGIRLQSDQGWIPVTCKRRSCPVCGPRRNREDARLLVLDARVDAPTHCITLTTSDPSTTAKAYREASAALWKRLRRLYGRVEYYGHIEWTTGRARRSGGHRRMHGHYLVKFRDHDQVDVLDVERVVRETWKRTTGAYVIEVAALVSPGAAIGYLSLHHRKPEQAAPAGWRGMVGRPSHGYFHRPVAELREQARRELRIEAMAWSRGVSAPEGSPVRELLSLEVEVSGKPQPFVVREPGPGRYLPEPDLPATLRLRERLTPENRSQLRRDRLRFRAGAPPGYDVNPGPGEVTAGVPADPPAGAAAGRPRGPRGRDPGIPLGA